MLKLRYLIVFTITLWCKTVLAEQITILSPPITCKALIESSFSDFVAGKNDNGYLLEFELNSENVKKKNTDFKVNYETIIELYGLDSYLVLSKEKNAEFGLVSIPDYRLPCRAKWTLGNNLGAIEVAQEKPDASEKKPNPSSFLAENFSEDANANNVPSPQKDTFALQSSFEFISEVSALVTFKISSNYKIPFVLVDGKEVELSNGVYEDEFYIPKIGTKLEVAISDRDGELSYEYVEINRVSVNTASLNTLERLQPKPIAKKISQNDLAIIIGLARYENTQNDAKYADRDASAFYDYARLTFGLQKENILELLNQNAEKIDIQKAIKIWLKQKLQPGESNVYIFFAGHGLAADNGEDSYLIPFDGEPEFLELSALSQKQLFADISELRPKRVFAFFDTCYSGMTRGEQTLVATRPIGIRAKEIELPENFVVFSAAGPTETARPIEDVKHGLFSYFVMRGLEGAADANADKTITSGELSAFVTKNVEQWSAGKQNPQIAGPTDLEIAILK